MAVGGVRLKIRERRVLMIGCCLLGIVVVFLWSAICGGAAVGSEVSALSLRVPAPCLCSATLRGPAHTHK